ncbi:MAG: hypothetical protein IH576_04195 [Deltaproteobacteria bacterium]|nr:hypothetical protein [Deltaproteobacteria bacterium]
MTVFPFQIGEVTGLYHRVLKSRDLSVETETAELKDVVTLSAEAKRQKILEETKNAVLSRIKSG